MEPIDLRDLCCEEPLPPNFETEMVDWFIQMGRDQGYAYLLAFAFDGVIWGKFDQGGLLLSTNREFTVDGEAVLSSSPRLTAGTLMQARLFGPRGELFIWREGDSFQARRLIDPPGDERLIIENQWLMGSPAAKESADGNGAFTLLSEGERGLMQAVPCAQVADKFRLALEVHHILCYDPQGRAYIGASRLAGIVPVNEEGEK